MRYDNDLAESCSCHTEALPWGPISCFITDFPLSFGGLKGQRKQHTFSARSSTGMNSTREVLIKCSKSSEKEEGKRVLRVPFIGIFPFWELDTFEENQSKTFPSRIELKVSAIN